MAESHRQQTELTGLSSRISNITRTVQESLSTHNQPNLWAWWQPPLKYLPNINQVKQRNQDVNQPNVLQNLWTLYSRFVASPLPGKYFCLQMLKVTASRERPYFLWISFYHSFLSVSVFNTAGFRKVKNLQVSLCDFLKLTCCMNRSPWVTRVTQN